MSPKLINPPHKDTVRGRFPGQDPVLELRTMSGKPEKCWENKPSPSFPPPPVPWGSMGQFGLSFGIFEANWRWLGLFYWEVKELRG